MPKKERELESIRVARVLRDDIIFGRRLPGSRLVEREIAEELRVSRLPVREAIQILAVEGIITQRPRTWAVVRTITPKELRDFAEVRKEVETLAFSLAAEKADEASLAVLRESADREAAAIAAGNAEAAQGAAWEFHRIVMQLADNATLDELMGVFFTRLRWLFGQHMNLDDAARDHVVMLDAFARRDIAELRTIVARHLDIDARFAEERLRLMAQE